MGRVSATIVRSAAILTWLVAAPVASMAQVTPDAASGFRGGLSERPSVLPPSVVTAPNSTPSPSQQLDIQNTRNQLEMRQRLDSARGAQGLQDQLQTHEQLNQLNMMQHR